MNPMIDSLLMELEMESQTTRRVLERVPANKLGWKPHNKSYSLGQLALHTASVPGAIGVRTDRRRESVRGVMSVSFRRGRPEP